MNYLGKKVAVLGFGIEGIDATKYMVAKKAQVTVFDQKEYGQLDKMRLEFRKSGVTFSCGQNYLHNGLSGFDIIVRSPSFWRFMPAIIEAEKQGSLVTSTIKIFFDQFKGKIIGVTGTKGKGTTSTLIANILATYGYNTFLAGNIGEPVLSLLPKTDKSAWAVLELSSFQLQDLNKSPNIAVVLFISCDHLDVHKNIDEYVRAKTNIVAHQNKKDFAVINADNPTAVSLSLKTPADKFYFSRLKKTNGAYAFGGKIYLRGKLLGQSCKLLLKGSHNWENITAAATAAYLAKVDVQTIKRVIFSFKGLEHRLELVCRKKGVEYYNDSFSTTPETAIAAIRSFAKPIILILGGSEKGADYNELAQAVSQSTVKVVILIGQMSQKINKSLAVNGFKGKIVTRCVNMGEIVREAFVNSAPGDVVLLSPACASFDMFKNYKDRGDQYKTNVREIK